MKTDKMLYELMDEIDDREAEMLNKYVSVSGATLKRQEKLIMDKIYEQMPKRKSAVRGRRKLVILVAVAVMMFGTAVLAKEQDWDVEMAELLGLSNVMDALDGGYVKIGKSDRQDNITVTAVQSIGDRNSQWIQFDTDIPWTVGEDGSYMFDESRFQFTRKNGGIITGGSQFYSYDNNGKVSFMLYAVGVEKINRANVTVCLGDLYEYESVGGAGKLLSEGEWNLAWTNYYAPNTITRYPMALADDIWIQKIEMSPVSVYVEGVAPRSKEMQEFIDVEGVKLEDGTIIFCRELTGGIKNNMFYESFVTYEDWNSVDVEEIVSVKINGKEISID